MNFRYTNEAIGEVSDILDYIAKDSPTMADKISQAIEHTIDMLRRQPRIARIVYHGQVRAFPVEDYPYRIFFQIKSSELVVRNVRHMRQRRPWEENRRLDNLV
jgi:plasmid stabilization system protein ParE